MGLLNRKAAVSWNWKACCGVSAAERTYWAAERCMFWSCRSRRASSSLSFSGSSAVPSGPLNRAAAKTPITTVQEPRLAIWRIMFVAPVACEGDIACTDSTRTRKHRLLDSIYRTAHKQIRFEAYHLFG